MAAFRFSQVDVFASRPLGGNPVAVVHGADDLDDSTMAAFARWTNLSETTFLLRPTTPEADYRLRIFTPGGELPFAGHPTLGSAHAWLENGGRPRRAGAVVQECAAGLVTLRLADTGIAFAAPPLIRFGKVDEEDLRLAVTALQISPADLVASSWVDNGPGWMGLQLTDARLVRELRPDFSRFEGLRIGVIGAYPEATGGSHTPGTPVDRPADFEVRAFVPGIGVPEDPVTGSLNAGLAQWLIGTGAAPEKYTVSQGTQLGRAGIVGIEKAGADIWVSGATSTVISGSLEI
ncbi:PhzF family phenazine biosynthesis protein [Brevibacterium daeguense]|uniref:PhzF family phenazine biosynthesis protein n=1 Tax=Brevibacterium daeguense TaxID=909936 RepID=A0ABP8EK70_9MICO|nr:PhzF family phenazine biosynthesis protein [Brevibacterium daeguense]